MMALRIIGVTGGIGSGKSTVSRILRDLGAAVIDADVIARTVTGKGGKALEELVAYFGTGILTAEGELDRQKMSVIVFDDPVRLHALNAITHKYVTEKILENIQSIKAFGNHDVIVVDCPLPVEHGFLDVVDEVWVVTADRVARVRRIMERSGCTAEEAQKRINAQKKEEEYLKLADEVIYNNNSIEELEKAVVRLFLLKRQDKSLSSGNSNSKGGLG
jgi:dephospho-CoA kinase